MKKQLIIVSIILVILSILSFFIGFTVQKTKLNKQINYLTIENKTIQKEKEHLIKQIKVLKDKKEEKSSVNTNYEYKHPIDIAEEILTNNMNLSAMRDKEISSKFISLEDFLSDNSDLKWSETRLNNKGEVTFQNKIILNNEGIPLKEDTAATTTEMKIMIGVKGIRPKPNCDESDTTNNGTFGCYMDVSSETSEEGTIPAYSDNLYDLSNNIIDIEQQKCYSFSHPYSFPNCGKKAEENWDKVILKYLAELKNTLPQSEYNDLLKNQRQWEKFVKDSKMLIDKHIIADKKTTYNLTLATRNMTLIKKQRALLLESIYYQSSEKNKIQNYFKEDKNNSFSFSRLFINPGLTSPPEYINLSNSIAALSTCPSFIYFNKFVFLNLVPPILKIKLAKAIF